jgi:hypothetical protein
MRRENTENTKSFIGLKRNRKNRAKQDNSKKENTNKNNLGSFKKIRFKPKKKENSDKSRKINKDNFNFCLTVHATEKDFEDPVKYLEQLWNENKESTGIIKIIPPERWKNFNTKIFNEKILPNLKNNEKTFETRIQTLNELLNGKVTYFINHSIQII